MFFLLFQPFFVAAQNDSLPLYQQFPEVPPLKITTVPGGKIFAKSDLKKKRPTLIILFNPDCDHCQHATRDLMANKAKFKKVQIVMSSSATKEMLESFYKEYGIAQMPNIIMGQDIGYFLSTFYQLQNVPAIFLYDKKGMLVKHFDGNVPFARIAQAL